MLIINKEKLNPSALADKNDKMHLFALEYDKGIKQLRNIYGDSINFKREGFPKRAKGIDSKNEEVDNLMLPTPQMRIPLKAQVDGKTGLELWECALGSPMLLQNGQWELGSKQAITIEDSLTLDLNKDAELAFFLYFKSPFFYYNPEQPNIKSVLVIDDPIADTKAEGDKERNELKLNTALYGVLEDETQLKLVAQAYGVSNTENKHPDSIRRELKNIVLEGDRRKRRDPMSRGIDEFLIELKINDAVRLRSLVKIAMDKDKIKWSPDGKFTIGQRELLRVGESDFVHRFDYLCNHLGNAANREKLQDLLRDVIDKEYLDKITDDKAYGWLARLMGIKGEFKKTEEVKELVYSAFIQG